jgi:hypothetical protein
MGFRTVAISQCVSDVWNVLSAAKAEFANYTDGEKDLAKNI